MTRALILMAMVFACAHGSQWLFGVLGAGLWALVLGMFVGSLYKNTAIRAHTSKLEKHSLAAAICALGFGMPKGSFDAPVFLLMAGMIGLLLMLSRILTKSQDPTLGLLLASGNGVCGSSAVLAVGGMVRAPAAEVALSIAVINALSTLGLAALPALGALLGLGDGAMAMLLGGSLQAVGHVVASASMFGPELVQQAMMIKMSRVALLIPLLLLLARKSRRPGGHWLRVLPWYLYGFLAAIGVAWSGFLPQVAGSMTTLSNQLFTFAMACLGFGIRPAELRSLGMPAFKLGLTLFGVQLLYVLGIIWVGGY